MLKGIKRFKITDAHIGKGSYGVISKGIDLLDNEIVAIKKVKQVTNEDRSERSALGESYGMHFTIIREINVMQELRSQTNVMNLKDVYMEGTTVCMAMSHMKSDLKKILDKKISFSEPQIKNILYQCVNGLYNMHKMNILHRDLVPANIFVSGSGDCKLADFGLSKFDTDSVPTAKTSMVVTIWYRAPELLYGSNYYSTAVDVWSIGCIFGEMLNAGKPLFPGMHEVDQLARIFSIKGTPRISEDMNISVAEGCEECELWTGCDLLPQYIPFSHVSKRPLRSLFPTANDTALKLLDRMLALNPVKRPSAEEILNDPYFKIEPLPCATSELPLHLL